MATPGSKSFQLININDEYIEFVVSYTLGHDYWATSGIGWMSKTAPKYYLRLLRINGKPAPESMYKKARVVLKNSSYKFKDECLDLMTLGCIENIFLKMPKAQNADPSIEAIKLRPRLASKR